MLLMAFARRWPVLHLDVPPGVPKLPILNLEPQQLALAFARPIAFPYARWDIAGVDHIPSAGPAIIVGNHRSYFDATAMALAIARSGRTVRFLGKKEVFDAPVVGQLAKALGGIRVERATGSDEPLRHAAEALGGRADGGDHAAGHHPAGPGVLRPGAEGPLGRGAPRDDDPRAGHPGGPVGDREGLAAIGPAAQHPRT